MTKITIPNDVTSQIFTSLLNSRDSLEICDSLGYTIGYFTPSPDLVLEPPPLSEEELTRRENEGPFYTTQQVLEHLRSL
jgi:hypothetical protein